LTERATRDLPLIMDIGMNNGRDSLFYLQKGFRVVAVEANPLLAEKARSQLSHFIASGQLIIEQVGLAESSGEFVFYQNLENDHWSSFQKEWGTRAKTRYREISVPCMEPQTLFERYGIPYYLKIDIEGNDIDVVRALRHCSTLPRYVSVEEHEAFYFAELWSLGYRDFKLVNQRELTKVKCPYPPREGLYVDAAFDGTTSGPFGEETPGRWLSFEQVMHQYLTKVRSPSRGFRAGNAWFDIHARLP
jgi:FkbM family methyltransferase